MSAYVPYHAWCFQQKALRVSVKTKGCSGNQFALDIASGDKNKFDEEVSEHGGFFILLIGHNLCCLEKEKKKKKRERERERIHEKAQQRPDRFSYFVYFFHHHLLTIVITAPRTRGVRFAASDTALTVADKDMEAFVEAEGALSMPLCTGAANKEDKLNNRDGYGG